MRSLLISKSLQIPNSIDLCGLRSLNEQRLFIYTKFNDNFLANSLFVNSSLVVEFINLLACRDVKIYDFYLTEAL